MGFAVYRGGSSGGGGFAAPGAPDLSQKPALPDPWQTLGRMNNPGMAAYQGPAAPSPVFPQPHMPEQATPWWTRRDHASNGPQMPSWLQEMPDWLKRQGGQPQASTSMGMAPSWQRMGVPGSMQQSLYGSGLLRPPIPQMNNQSGY
jgi:hypothetical protein